MNQYVLIVVAALMIGAAEGVPASSTHESTARQAAPQTSQPQKHKARRQSAKPRVYGTPIQPPIMKKRGLKRTGAANATDPTARRKAAAAKARRSEADLARRRANPAAANGPR
jgi:hypothetical protein